MIINPTGALVEEKASYTAEETELTPGASSVTAKPTASNGLLTKVTVKGDSNLVASNIKKDVSIFGVTGTYTTTTTSTISLCDCEFYMGTTTTYDKGTDFVRTYTDSDKEYASVYTKPLISTTNKSVFEMTKDSSGNLVSWRMKSTVDDVVTYKAYDVDEQSYTIGGTVYFPSGKLVTCNINSSAMPDGTYGVTLTNLAFRSDTDQWTYFATKANAQKVSQTVISGTLVMSGGSGVMKAYLPSSLSIYAIYCPGWGIDEWVDVYSSLPSLRFKAQWKSITSYTAG